MPEYFFGALLTRGIATKQFYSPDGSIGVLAERINRPECAGDPAGGWGVHLRRAIERVSSTGQPK